jgi:predicted DNA-binding transcriptional regulator YafY
MSYLLASFAGVRADRLVSIVLLLQAHGQQTAAQLAERLETSERTIRRDLDSLSGAGVPVYAQRGRGGGWALLGGHRLNLSGLTAEEAQALFLVAGPHALSGSGVAPGVRSALRKLLAALPEQVRDRADAARSAVIVDPAGWGRRADDPAHLDVLREAVVAGMQVDITYAKPGQEPAERRIHPYGLVQKRGTWYLLAGSAGGLRTFRLSRVMAVAPTEAPVERPDDFDLTDAWETVQSGFADRMSGVTVELRVEPAARRLVAAVLRGWTVVDESSAGGGQAGIISVAFPHAGAAAHELARFGGAVEVLSPPEVRSELARIAGDLTALYG